MLRATVMGPRVLGIDDWAWKKRHRYGTILCDLEAGKVVDLLPDRESATVADWLGQVLFVELQGQLNTKQKNVKLAMYLPFPGRDNFATRDENPDSMRLIAA